MKKTFSKKLLAFLLSVLMVVTSVPLVAIAATGDTGTLDPVTSLICNDSSRPHTRSNLAILNDGAEGNTSVGVLKYTLPNVPTFKNANLGVTFTFPDSSTFKNNQNYTLDIYFIDLSKTGYNNVNNNSIKSFWSGMSFGDNAVSNIKSKLGLSDSNKIGSYAYSQLTQGVTVDLTNAANTALENSYGSFGLIFINSGVGGKGSNGWSDIYCNIGTFSYTEGDDVSASDLAAVISKYETKMNGTVYTNMKSAYEAYIAARKIQDGYVKEGDANYASTLQLAQTLLAKTNAMDVYSGPNVVNSLSYGGTTVDSQYFGNLLSVPNLANMNSVSAANDYKIEVSKLNDLVVLYDGNDSNIRIPINVGMTNNSGSSDYYFTCFYKNSGPFTMSRNTQFADGGSASNWNINSQYAGVSYGEQRNNIDTSIYAKTRNQTYYGSNYVTFQNSGIISSTQYSATASMSFNSYRSWKEGWGRGYGMNNSVSTDNFYIINYQPVSSALNSSANTNKIKATNFKNSTYSSVSSVLGYYDALTGKKYTFGVQSNDNGNVNSSNVYNLTSSLSNGVNNLNKSSLVKCVSAESLKAVIASNKDLATSENTFYTTSSFKSYSEAYANAVSYLASIDEYDLGYLDTTYAENITKAYNNLVEKADFSGIEKYLNDYKDICTNGMQKGDNQEYTYSAYLNLKTAYDALKSYYDGIADKNDYSNSQLSANGTTYTSAMYAATKAIENNKAKPATDYSAYDKLIEAVKQQDMNAFTESYINSDTSVYGLIGQYGTNASSITFNNGVANGVTETTPTDGTASTAYVNVNGTIWKNATQTELDNYVGAVKTELNSALGDETGAKRNAYTVTVTEYTNDEAGTPSTATKYFGDNFDVPNLDSTVAKIVVNGKEFPATDSFTVRIQSNTDIKVYKTDSASLADKKAVQVQDIYGKSAQAYYLDSNATVKFEGNQFTSGSASYQAQEIGSYAFVKWQVNGKDVASGATMSVSEIQTIKPVYKVSTEKSYNVTLDGTAVKAVNTKNIYYDSKVVVKPADGAYALAAKIGDAYYVVNYGAGEYTFYGCGDVNLYSVMSSENGYTVNGKSLDAATAEKLTEKKPFVWSVKDDNGTKLTTYSTFTNGTKIIEAGTMYYVSETAPSEESFKLGNAGVRSVAAKNPNAESSQYWLGITYGSKKLYTRAYVKYETTVNGTTVQVIDYGNIVSNAK